MSSTESTADRRKDRYIGQQINHLRLTSCIGTGGFGAVYRAEHEKLGTAFAVKLLHLQHLDNDKLIQRFEREARTIAQLSHPHIIRVSDFGQTEDGSYYLVMDFLSGMPLNAAIERGQRFTTATLRTLFQQIGSALDYVHRKSIVHRDLKPENIFIEIDPHKKEHQAKILDFGIAGIAREPTLTGTGAVLGSPLYMSPEQIQGNTKEADARSDLYSLGIVLFQTLTGEAPFMAGDILGVLYKHIHDPVPLLHERRPAILWARELQAFLHRALAKQPEQRFQTAEDFTKALDLALAKQEALAPQATFPQRLTLEAISQQETILPAETPIHNPSLPRLSSLPNSHFVDSLQLQTPTKPSKMRYLVVVLFFLLAPVGWFGYMHFAAPLPPNRPVQPLPPQPSPTISVSTKAAANIPTKAAANVLTKAAANVPTKAAAKPPIGRLANAPPPIRHDPPLQSPLPLQKNPSRPLPQPRSIVLSSLPKEGRIALANGILAYPAATPNLPTPYLTITTQTEGAVLWQGQMRIGPVPITLIGPAGSTYQLQLTAPHHAPKNLTGALPQTDPVTQVVDLIGLPTAPHNEELRAFRRQNRRKRNLRIRRQLRKQQRKEFRKQLDQTTPPKTRVFEVDVFP